MIAALAAAVGLAVAPALAPAPARLQVGAEEFRYSLSRQSIKAGPAIVELANFGEDEHDLRLRRVGGTRRRGGARDALRSGPVQALVLARRPPRPRHARDARRPPLLTTTVVRA